MCLHGALCSFSLCLLSENKLTFDPTQGSRVCKDIMCACMLLYSSFPLIWYATWSCSEKVEFWPFDPTPNGRGEGSTGKIFTTTLLHASFPLIWYVTWPYSEKVKFWPLPQPHKSTQGAGPRPSNKYPAWYLHICWASVCMRNFSELLRNLNILPLTPPKGSGGRGKNFIPLMLIYRHWVIITYSEKW